LAILKVQENSVEIEAYCITRKRI